MQGPVFRGKRIMSENVKAGAGALYLERQGLKRFSGAKPAGPRQPR
jgi:hypothetical protein